MKTKIFEFKLKQIMIAALAAGVFLTGLATSSRRVSGAGFGGSPIPHVPQAYQGAATVQYSPQAFVFSSLLPGETRTGGATVGKSPSAVNVTAKITDDTSGGLFKNLHVIVYDVERGPNGRPLGITEVGSSDGVTPLPVDKDQMVRFEFDYSTPNPPPNDTHSAILNVNGAAAYQFGAPWKPFKVFLYSHVGRVKTTLLQDTISIRQGEAGDLPVELESLAGPQTTANYVLASGPESQYISLDTVPNPIPVAKGGRTQGAFRFTIDGRAAVGDHVLSIYEYAFNNGQSDVLAQHPVVKVLPNDPWAGADHPTKLLVISPRTFESALQPLIAHKNATGMPALLMTIDDLRRYFYGADDQERIKRCIADAHEKLGAQYVMLVGDASVFPARYRFVNSRYETRTDRWWDGTYHPSDLYYANLYHNHSAASGSITHGGVFDDWDQNQDGKYNEQFWVDDRSVAWTMNPDFVDGCPDVAVGRLPAHTAAEVTIYVNKVIRYETGAGFVYNTGRYTFLAAKSYDGAKDYSDEIINDSGVGGAVSQSNLCRVGLDYADTDQLASPWVKGNFESMRVSALGSWWISYIGHGYNLGWAVVGGYNDQRVRALDNRNALPIVFSAACETGQFAPTPPHMPYRDSTDKRHNFWYDSSKNVVVDTETNVTMSVPIISPSPNAYDFPDTDNRTFACSWLVGPNEGGAIAYFGEVLVCENSHGKDLEKRVLTQYVRGGERVLGELWLKGAQQYWKDFERDEGVFHAPRIYLGVMTLFGDPSLRLR